MTNRHERAENIGEESRAKIRKFLDRYQELENELGVHFVNLVGLKEQDSGRMVDGVFWSNKNSRYEVCDFDIPKRTQRFSQYTVGDIIESLKNWYVDDVVYVSDLGLSTQSKDSHGMIYLPPVPGSECCHACGKPAGIVEASEVCMNCEESIPVSEFEDHIAACKEEES